MFTVDCMFSPVILRAIFFLIIPVTDVVDIGLFAFKMEYLLTLSK